VALLAVLALAAIASIELVARFPALVRARVLEEASARGLRIEKAEVEPVGLLPWQQGPRMVVLREVVATVDGVDGVELRLQRVEVDVDGLTAVRARAVGISVRAVQPAGLFSLERVAREGRLAELPVEVEELRLRVQQLVPSLPASLLVELDRASIVGGKLELEDQVLRVEVPIVPGVKLGPHRVGVERADGRIEVRAEALPGVSLRTDESLAKVELRLEKSGRDQLRTMVPWIELPPLSVEAQASILLEGKGAPRGSFSATVEGWTPPRPKELGGIAYGKTTRLRASFAREGLASARLDDVEVVVGALELRGRGRVDLLGGGKLTLELNGSIDCRQLAASAIGAHLGLPAGAIAAQLTRGRLGGNVAVGLRVEAPLSRPTEAEIAPSAVLRCKLVL
jgi:hypothetical protein